MPQHGGGRDARDHAAQHDDDQHAGSRHQSAFPLFALFRHDPGRARRDQSVLARLLRARGGAEAEAANRCDRRRRCRTSADGARENAKSDDFKIVYDQSYPPSTTDFAPVMRAVQAANPDIVFAAAYPPDTVGIVRAANEIGLVPKMFGGSLIGLFVTPIKMQLGPLINGIVINESFVPALDFPGTTDLMKKYQAMAPGKGI